MKPRHLPSPYCCFALLISFASASVAQTEALTVGAPTGNETTDLMVWRELRAQNVAATKTEPQRATDQYLEFLRAGAKSSPQLNSSIAIDAWNSTIDLVDRVVKTPEMALTLCDEALSLYGKHPRGTVLLAAEMRVLVYEGKNADAEALVVANWPQIVQAPALHNRTIVWQACLALQAEDKREQIPALLENVMVENPALLDQEQQGSNGWMYRYLIRELLVQGKSAEALSWARLGWMECAFDDQKLQGAASLLAQACSKTGQDKAQLEALRRLIAAPDAPPTMTPGNTPEDAALNLLLETAPPALGPQKLEMQLLRLASRPGQWSHEPKTHQRISLLIFAGDWGRAMSEARGLWMDQSTSPLGVKEIARVYKARDLNLSSANAFLSWVETNQGPNPLEQFFADHPVAGVNPQALPKTINPEATITKVSLVSDAKMCQSGEPTLNDVLYELSAPSVLDGKTQANTMRQMLLGLMVEHGEVGLSEALKNQETKRWVSYAYAAAGDGRAVPLLEELLARIPQPAPDDAKAIESMYLLMRLSGYYEKKGEWTKAAETQLRGHGYAAGSVMSPDSPKGQVPVAGMMANRMIEAARLYQRAGNSVRAKELYAEVPLVGYGWCTAMSFHDQAQPLLQAGKYAEAQVLLSQPVYPAGVAANDDSNRADAFLAQNAWLAETAYRQGHLEEAYGYGLEATKLGENTKSLFSDSLELYDPGRDVYLRAGGWKEQPIQSDVKEVIIKTNSLQPDKPSYARFRIKTYGDAAVIATVDNPALQVQVLPIDNWSKNALEFKEKEREVVIQLEPSENPKNMSILSLSDGAKQSHFKVRTIKQ